MFPKYGDWTIIEELGSGSYGSVYLIEREDFGHVEQSALKVLSIPKNASDIQNLRNNGMSDKAISEYYYSFAGEIVKEYELMTKLKGTTNIVSYEDHVVQRHEDQIGWDILIRMELLQSLNSYIAEKQRHIFKRDVIKLGIDICEALERCQKFNIIHRDIKPDNIFISHQGDFKLGDFGVARTLEGTVHGMTKTGTPGYMAPEVYQGKDYGYSVDIYSLGMVMYKLINNNSLPFLPADPSQIKYADHEQALIRRMSGEPLPMPCMDQNRLAEIVLKACSYNPGDRYSSPTAMKQDLEAILYSKNEQKWILEYIDQLPTLPPENSRNQNPSSEEPTETMGRWRMEQEKHKKDEPNQIEKPLPDIPWLLIGVFAIIAVMLVFVVLPRFVNKNENVNPADSSLSPESSIVGEASTSEPESESIQEGVTTEIGDAGYKLEKEYDGDLLLKETQYHADGTLGFTYENTYDEQENLLETIVRRADGSVWKKTINEYNASSELLKEESYENDSLVYYSLYEWDEKGQKAAFSRYNAEDTLEETHTFDYSEDGTYTETVKMGETGALSQSTTLDGAVIDIVKVVYFYDVSGQMERQSDYDANDELVDYCEIKYDYRFRQTQQSWYYGNGVVEGHVEYKYSEDGSTTEETLYDANGKILLFIQNEHGADGRLTITQYDKERSIVAQEVYDEEGNSLSRDDYGTLEETSENQ